MRTASIAVAVIAWMAALQAHAVAATCSSPAFATPRHFPLEGINGPRGAVVADLNGDGHLDVVALAATESDGQRLHVLLGDGSGGFGVTSTPLPDEPTLERIKAADVTGDGIHDVVATANSFEPDESAYFVVLEGDGAGGFSPRPPLTLGAGLGSDALDLADVDDDGDFDAVALTTRDDGTFAGAAVVLTNDASGGFAVALEVAVGTSPVAVKLADFDGDGDTDLAVAVFGVGEAPVPSTVDLRLGDGGGGFGPPVSSHVVPRPAGIAAGDFNEDGHLDVVVPTWRPDETGTMTVLLADGAGSLRPPEVVEAAAELFEVVVADFTGDGHLDLGGAGWYRSPAGSAVNPMAVFAGAGNGTFGTPTFLHPQSHDRFLPLAGDFDGDGRIDLVTAGTGPDSGSRVSLLLSMCGNTADLAASLSDAPDPVISGRSVTYTIEVVNNGPDPASASLGFAVPAGMRLVSATASTGGCAPARQHPADGIIRCALGDLTGAAPGNTSTITVIMLAGSGGTTGSLARVVTAVVDPVPANDSDTETTLVKVPGGLDPAISAPGGATSLTWTDGDAEAGYVVWRSAGGVVTRFPTAGMLPADAASFVDPSPASGVLNCYRVVPSAADETPLAISSSLCQWPEVASPPGALDDFGLRLLPPGNAVRLDWSPFGGQTGYVIRRYRASGQSQTPVLPAAAVSSERGLPEFTCYVLIPLNGTTPLANSPLLCADPPSP